MPYIIGRGRTARETYPERSTAQLGVLKVGYDQPLVTDVLPDVPNAVLPKGAGAPLQVQLLGVTTGNILEVDCTVSIGNTDDATHSIVTFAAVNFDASPAPFGPGVGWSVIALSLAAQPNIPPQLGESLPQLRNFVAVQIPAGAVNATVQITYFVDSNNDLEIFGTDSGGPLTTLKASELSSLTVQQVGPAFLVPV